MRNISYLTVAALILGALLTSCDKRNEIIKDDDSLIFSFHRGGSWVGLDENLTINAGATHFSISYRDLQTSERKSYETTVKTSIDQWNDLTKSFNLETFTKIGNGPCRACADGFDELFSVIKDGTTYTFSNGDADEHYKQMKEFFDSILKQVDYFESVAKY